MPARDRLERLQRFVVPPFICLVVSCVVPNAVTADVEWRRHRVRHFPGRWIYGWRRCYGHKDLTHQRWGLRQSIAQSAQHGRGISVRPDNPYVIAMPLRKNGCFDRKQIVERNRCVNLPHKRLVVSSGASAAAVSVVESP